MPLSEAGKDRLTNTALPLISQASGILGGILQRKFERKQYDKMLEYNHPKQQMQRYREAGLSPYLIYGSANAGNASSPQPAPYVPTDSVSKGIGEYIGMNNFSEDLKTKRLQNAILAKDLKMKDQQAFNLEWDGIMKHVNFTRKGLDLQADYPGWNNTNRDNREIYESDVTNSFRRKLNELKTAFSQATIDRLRTQITGMSYENSVKRMRGYYADRFGMVGGDWTQGLGLIKSMPKIFKSSGKLSPQQQQLLKRAHTKTKFP